MRAAILRVRELFAANQNLADVAKTFVVRVLAAGLAFGVQVFLARSLAMGEYGIYVTFWTWMMVINLVAVFGFSESSLRFLPRYIQRKQHHWAMGFLKTGYLFTVFGALFLGVFGLVLLWVLKDLVAPSHLIPLMIVAIGLPIMALELYLEGVSRAFGWYMLTTIPGYVVRPLFLAIGVFAILQLGITPDAAMVLALVIIVTIGIVLFQSAIIWFRIKKLFGRMQKASTKKLWVKSSLPLMLVAGVDEMYVWSDILILSFLVSAPEVAIYFAAQRSLVDHCLQRLGNGPIHGTTKNLCDVKRDVQTDAVGEFDRAHRHAESFRRFVDLGQRHTFFGEMHRLTHVRRQYSIHHESRRTCAFQRQLANSLGESESEIECILFGIGTANDLDQRQHGNRIEKVQSNKPFRIVQHRTQFLQANA